MKKIQFILLLAFTSLCFSQVSITTSKKLNDSSLDVDLLNKFKTTTTVFVLKDWYLKEEYEKVLNETWMITPFKVLLEKDFQLLDYLSIDYSIASMSFSHIEKGNSPSAANMAFFRLDFRVFNEEQIESIKKKFLKMKKGKKYDLGDFLAKESDDIAHIFFSPKYTTEAAMGIFKAKFKPVSEWLNSGEIVFFNYSLGLLKNYFTTINTNLSIGSGLGLYSEYTSPELKSLKVNKLFIPMDMKDVLIKEKDLIKSYKYDYEFIENSELSNRIVNNDEFYYLRVTIINSDKFLEIVNSKTGKVIHKKYSAMSFKFKKRNFEKLSEAISKS
jgi:hypothetical protein